MVTLHALDYDLFFVEETADFDTFDLTKISQFPFPPHLNYSTFYQVRNNFDNISDSRLLELSKQIISSRGSKIIESLKEPKVGKLRIYVEISYADSGKVYTPKAFSSDLSVLEKFVM